MKLVMDRYLVHDCPVNGEMVLPPELAVNAPALSRRWRCEFCGLDEIED